jgi:hypothetical protein
MKRKVLVLSAMVLGLMGSGFAMAQDKPDVPPGKQPSTTTRKATQAECEAARKAGKVVEGECQPDVPPGKQASTKTREQVQKECAEARKAGKVVEGECKP